MKAQVNIMQRDCQIKQAEQEEKRQLKIRGILKNLLRHFLTANVDPAPQARFEKNKENTLTITDFPTLNIAALIAAIDDDSCQEQWRQYEMPDEAAFPLDVKILNAVIERQD